MNATVAQKSLDEVLAAIAALDLDPIKVKLMHEESGEGWSREYADRMELEYRRFLELMVKYPEEAIAPSMDVDEFWHYHILDTMKYAEDCQKVFGHFLHHFPYIGLRGEEDLKMHEAAGESTRRLYEREFGAAEAGQTAFSWASARPAFSWASGRPAFSWASGRKTEAKAEQGSATAFSWASARPAFSWASGRPAFSWASGRKTEAKQEQGGATAFSWASARPAFSWAAVRTALSWAAGRRAGATEQAGNASAFSWAAARPAFSWAAGRAVDEPSKTGGRAVISVEQADFSRRPTLKA